MKPLTTSHFSKFARETEASPWSCLRRLRNASASSPLALTWSHCPCWPKSDSISSPFAFSARALAMNLDPCLSTCGGIFSARVAICHSSATCYSLGETRFRQGVNAEGRSWSSDSIFFDRSSSTWTVLLLSSLISWPLQLLHRNADSIASSKVTLTVRHPLHMKKLCPFSYSRRVRIFSNAFFFLLRTNASSWSG